MIRIYLFLWINTLSRKNGKVNEIYKHNLKKQEVCKFFLIHNNTRMMHCRIGRQVLNQKFDKAFFFMPKICLIPTVSTWILIQHHHHYLFRHHPHTQWLTDPWQEGQTGCGPHWFIRLPSALKFRLRSTAATQQLMDELDSLHSNYSRKPSDGGWCRESEFNQ